MSEVQDQVYRALDALGIRYETFHHPPVFNSEDVERYWKDIPATPVKNLFLRNKKGDRHYLVILAVDKQADLRQLVRIVGDDRLSFGSAERLMAHLGVTPGSVSVFGLIHDNTGAVRVIVDKDLRSAERLIFHPNDNTASVTIAFADFEKFLNSRNNPVRWISLADTGLDARSAGL
jgi:Ala-tRNA(Pro) deacylase